ncbi:MAG TPA: His/Gly/Thr/Pro-type tRNA ligase C-terminal domain-containing protein, partial [Nakamurella sp.]
KVPFLLLAGEKDVTAGAVSFRFRDGTQVNGVPVDQAVDAIDGWIRSRSNTSPTAEAFAFLIPDAGSSATAFSGTASSVTVPAGTADG